MDSGPHLIFCSHTYRKCIFYGRIWGKAKLPKNAIFDLLLASVMSKYP
jgi:hypothetical protein